MTNKSYFILNQRKVAIQILGEIHYAKTRFFILSIQIFEGIIRNTPKIKLKQKIAIDDNYY